MKTNANAWREPTEGNMDPEAVRKFNAKIYNAAYWRRFEKMLDRYESEHHQKSQMSLFEDPP
jgi:hypothetical protein